MQSKATFNSIKVSWSAPTPTAGEEICVDYYYVQYSFGLDYEMAEAVELEFELTQLKPFTTVSFKITAECQGRLGPQVLIGHSTGNNAEREYYMYLLYMGIIKCTLLDELEICLTWVSD